jgi:hypothetical protein
MPAALLLSRLWSHDPESLKSAGNMARDSNIGRRSSYAQPISLPLVGVSPYNES